MYGKIFAQIYSGTLATRGPWQALITFQQMIILADKHGIVDATPEVLSRQTTIPLTIIKTGLRALEKPDPDSRTPDEGGRRIVRLNNNRSWGWRIVNYEKYRVLRSQDDRTEYHRRYWQKKRSPKTRENAASTGLNNSSLSETQQDSTNSTKAVSSKQEAINNHPHTPSRGGDLVFPKGLTAGQRESIATMLNGLDGQGQVVLDELTGVMKASPIANPVGYVRALLQAVKSGGFTPERAHSVSEEREWVRTFEEAQARGDNVEVIRLLNHQPKALQKRVAM